MTIALLLAGLALPALAADEMQPDTLSNHVSGFFYSAGRSYLGVDIRDITPERASALKLKEERGVEVTMVDQDAPAGKAGLREHDVITEFNSTAVESEEQLRRLIRETPPGRTVAIGISRDGAPMKLSVQLADHSKVVAQAWPRVDMQSIEIPDSHNRMEIPNIQIQTYSSALGAQTESLTRQLGEYFGVKDGEGILVRSVEKGSAAEKAGLKAGDVIVKADNEKLNDRSDLSHILRNHRSGGKLNLVVMRDKKEQTIVVTLPDRSSRDSSWILIDPEEWLSSWDHSLSLLRDMKTDPQLLALTAKLDSMRSRLDAIPSRLNSISPQTQKAMRDAERRLEKSRELLKGLLRNSDFI
jgi:S1-C subfamily serine protease